MATGDKLVSLDGLKVAYDNVENNIVTAQSTQPTSSANRIWFPDSSAAEVEVPTYEEFSSVKSALNVMNQQLTMSFTSSGVRTWELTDTGMIIGQRYYLQIASYSGANTLTRVTVRFYDANTTLLETVGDNLVVGSVINFVVPANAAKFRLLYYISANESASARLTVNIWEYRFQSVLDSLASGLSAKVEGQTFGYIYSGNINIDRTNNTITSTSLRVITSRGVYNSISDASISFDSSSLLFVGYSASDSSHALTTYQLNFATSPDKVLLFAYQNGRLYFTDQYGKITINGGKYNPINNSRVICCLGDSFTAGGNSWPTQLNKQTNCVVANLGVAGSRMTVTYTSGSTEYKCFIDRVADGALDSYTPDLIVVFGGMNDAVKLHNNQCRIGEIADEAEYSTTTTSGYSFIARVKYLINLIKTKKPGVPILGVLPPDYSEGTSDYEWWYDYIGQIRDALQAVYELYGIPYVNLKKDCQEMYIDDYNLSTYRINGLSNMHPSVAGATAIGKIIYTCGVRDLFYMDSN